MRIVYLAKCAVPSRRASSIHVMKMCAALAACGHTVSLVVPQWRSGQESGVDDPFAFYGLAPCFRLVRLPYRSIVMRAWTYAVASARFVRRETPDLVYGRFLRGCALTASSGMATVFETHAPAWEDGIVSRFFFRRLTHGPGFVRLVVISEALRERYAAYGSPSPDKIVVAHDGADEVAVVSPLSPWPGRVGALQVGYVGHLYKGKGMEVVTQLAERLPSVDFHVVGGTRADIQHWRKRSAAENLQFHGFVPPATTPAYLAGLDICLLPNQRRVLAAGATGSRARNISAFTSPLKMFEYMAHGKAIIASDLPVLREVLNESNAVLVDPEDVAGWARAVQRLDDETVRCRIGARAREDFLARYTWRARAERILRACREEI